MSRITIYGNKRDRKAVLEFLQRRRIVDICEPDAEEQELGFGNMNTGENQSEFSRNSALGARALEILAEYAPEKSGMLDSLNGRKLLDAEEYYKYVDDIPEMFRIAKTLISLSDEIAEKKGEIVRAGAAIEELQPWLNLDIAMDTKGTADTKVMIGSFPGDKSEEEILTMYHAEKDVPPIYIEVVSRATQQTCIFAMCSAKMAQESEKRLRAIGFLRPKVQYSGIPREETEQYKKRIDRLKLDIADLEEEIRSYRGTRNALKFLVDYYAMRAEKYNVLGKLNQRRRIFMITGYVPQSSAAALAATLEHEYNAAVEIEQADGNAPVMLKNGYLAEPVEGVVETFAMPGRGEIDPTSIMSIFYYVFFGLMLSDAGYGLLMALGCGTALLKFKNMETGMRKTLRMFLYCGISTMFWGVMFGGYFGDAIPVISSTFFKREITIPPLWFEPVKDPMRMLMFSFLLGVIHLFVALGIKLYQCIKARDLWVALTDCIFWYMLVGGLIVYLFRVDMFLSMANLTTKLPEVWANIAAGIAIAGAVGIVLFTARSGGAGKRLAKGAYALYGATSWLSDILSYSRLLALGLATGVIATVFNKMGSMFGGGILGAVIFTLVFLIGHALNLGVNLLGAYVHTNRLQFVEFFGKFYEGGGRPFKPFAADTKYYKFREENNYHE